MKGAKEIHTSYSEKMSENLSDQRAEDRPRLRRKHSITLISGKNFAENSPDSKLYYHYSHASDLTILGLSWETWGYPEVK